MLYYQKITTFYFIYIFGHSEPCKRTREYTKILFVLNIKRILMIDYVHLINQVDALKLLISVRLNFEISILNSRFCFFKIRFSPRSLCIFSLI
jgi:hypothetical protein